MAARPALTGARAICELEAPPVRRAVEPSPGRYIDTPRLRGPPRNYLAFVSMYSTEQRSTRPVVIGTERTVAWDLKMNFAKLSVASACALVVGCGGSSQTDEAVTPDSAVAQEQVERMDQAERATAAAPALVAGGAKPASVKRTVTCANGSTVAQAAGYYASGGNWLLGSFLPACPGGGAGVAAPAPAPAPVAAPRPAPAPVAAATPVAAPAPAPAASPAPAPTPVAAPAPAGATAAATTYVNPALVPGRVHAGTTQRLISVTGQVAQRDAGGIGASRTVCSPSHFAFDDPLVYPGQPGRAHLHVFFGNTGLNANSTPDSVRNSGGSTCRGGIVNRSAYWAPAMIDTTTGRPVVPTSQNFAYYKTGYFGVRDADVKVIPAGFRMIAGDAKSQVAQTNVVHYECNNGQYPSTIPNCGGSEMVMAVTFPQCWDGVNLSSPDHRSHVAYPTEGRGCADPRYPVAIPQITLRIVYAVPPGGTANWRLSSDINGSPAGASAHADWMNGWEQDILTSWTTRIINLGLSSSGAVGDGRSLFDPAL
jgi:Domain of unknown function (DUF1996)